MWIDIDDAVQIYARMLRARLGSITGAQAARETADRLRGKGDRSGVEVREAIAAEPDAVKARRIASAETPTLYFCGSCGKAVTVPTCSNKLLLARRNPAVTQR